MATLINGDCLDKLRELDDNSVDSVVTDPPYGFSFMGKSWDYDVPSKEIWMECMRVLKPGGYLLSFSGARTYHRMAVEVEDAGFEIRDQIMWVYGSGFPKSHNVGKAVDKLQGNEREVTGERKQSGTKFKLHADPEYTRTYQMGFNDPNRTSFETTKGSSEWEGWGTALKPAHEPIVMARKPFKGTVANNVLEYGTGAINIDGCRVAATDKAVFPEGDYTTDTTVGSIRPVNRSADPAPDGRYPANFIHDGSDEVVELFPDSNGSGGSTPNVKVTGYGDGIGNGETQYFGGERTKHNSGKGSAARFFYCAKASKKDRNAGCEDLPDKEWRHEGAAVPERKNRPFNPSKNNHPTVKPNALMRYLCRLVTRPGGVVLDPFMGSGSTGRAALEEGFEFIGIEREPDYFSIAQARCGV